MLEVTVAGEPDPATGMVLDLKELKDILQREIVDRMDHRHLNHEVPELAGMIPTCENIAAVIWHLLEPNIKQGQARSRAAVRIARPLRRLHGGIEWRRGLCGRPRVTRR